MSELKIWTDGTENYVAESAEEAMGMQLKTLGENPGVLADWYECRDETLSIVDDQYSDMTERTTMVAAEWIASNGPGFLCSTEW